MGKFVFIDAGHGGIWSNFYIATSGYPEPGFRNSTVDGIGINDPNDPYYIPKDKRKKFQYDKKGRWFYPYKGYNITYGDPGVVSPFFNEIQEQKLTFIMANELKYALGNAYSVQLTRPYDGYVHLQQRWHNPNIFFNQATSLNPALKDQFIFVSIHCNSHDKDDDDAGKEQGFEIYTRRKSDPASTKLAKKLSDSIKAYFRRDSIPHNTTAIKEKDYLVLRHNKMPAVLVETAYFDNKEDTARIVDDAKRSALVTALRDGIDQYFDYPRKPDDDKALLNGTVVDKMELVDGKMKRISGIKVIADLNGNVTTTTTDLQGNFKLTLAKLGNYKLTFEDPGNGYKSLNFFYNMTHYKLQLNVVKLEALHNSNVLGSVYNLAASPLEGVRVELINQDTGQSAGVILTDQYGIYKFRITADAMYKIIFSMTGYQEYSTFRRMSTSALNNLFEIRLRPES